jgi:hypothetical protein
MTKHWLMHKHANAKVEWIDRVKGKTQQRTTIQCILLYIIGSWIIGLFGSYHVGTMSKINIRAMVFNATVNNVSVISWKLVVLVEETQVLGENHRHAANH